MAPTRARRNSSLSSVVAHDALAPRGEGYSPSDALAVTYDALAPRGEGYSPSDGVGSDALACEARAMGRSGCVVRRWRLVVTPRCDRCGVSRPVDSCGEAFFVGCWFGAPWERTLTFRRTVSSRASQLG